LKTCQKIGQYTRANCHEKKTRVIHQTGPLKKVLVNVKMGNNKVEIISPKCEQKNHLALSILMTKVVETHTQKNKLKNSALSASMDQQY